MIAEIYNPKRKVIDYIENLITTAEEGGDYLHDEDKAYLDNLKRKLAEVKKGTGIGRRIYRRWEDFYERHFELKSQNNLEELKASLEECIEEFLGFLSDKEAHKNV